MKIAGAAMPAASLALLIVARLQLGASFSVQAKAKKLVTTGIYSRIRNPIYVFGGVLLVGLSMLLETVVAPVAGGGADSDADRSRAEGGAGAGRGVWGGVCAVQGWDVVLVEINYALCG